MKLIEFSMKFLLSQLLLRKVGVKFKMGNHSSMHNNPHHSDSDDYDRDVRRRSSVTEGALAYAFARAQEIKHYHPTLIDCNEIVNIGGGDGTAASEEDDPDPKHDDNVQKSANQVCKLVHLLSIAHLQVRVNKTNLNATTQPILVYLYSFLLALRSWEIF